MKLTISPMSHDCAVAVEDKNQLIFASHSERYSRIKNDPNLCEGLIKEAMSFGDIDEVVYCERPLLKKERQLYARQWGEIFDVKPISKTLKEFGIPSKKLRFVKHHLAHAQAARRASPYADCCIVCIDAIGEWDTITIWDCISTEYKLVARARYPHSLGLLYSAFTQRCDLKPNEDEYIMMGMAAFGEPKYVGQIYKDFIDVEDPLFRLKINCHRGIGDYLSDAKVEDIAASIQKVAEECIYKIIKLAKSLTNRDSLIYTGGVALNCVANSKIRNIFNEMWIYPNPGDAGTCLGSTKYGSHPSQYLDWNSFSVYCGHNIDRPFELDNILKELLKGNVVGVANGKAEFGPRAFGNRSLLADPRFPYMKDKVNEIKKRQKFRPFAPAVLAEKARDIFEIDSSFDKQIIPSPFMQYVFKCKYPESLPAVVHVDNTSRIQTVHLWHNKNFNNLIEAFYEKTGCPVLLNTSLNIKGEPLVNTWEDAKRFERKYNVKVF